MVVTSDRSYEPTSPLLAVERSVHETARELRLDLGDPRDRERLEQLIDEAIADWNAEHRRGRRERPIGDPDALADRARRNLLGYGPLGPLLDDPDVWEIMVNAPDEAFR